MEKVIEALNKKIQTQQENFLLLLGIWIVLQILNLTKEYLYTKMSSKIVAFSEQTPLQKDN